MTEEELRKELTEVGEKAKPDLILVMAGVLNTYKHGMDEGIKVGSKKEADRAYRWLVMNMTSAVYMGADGSILSKPEFLERFKEFMEGGKE